jgi:hypothetical protein
MDYSTRGGLLSTRHPWATLLNLFTAVRRSKWTFEVRRASPSVRRVCDTAEADFFPIPDANYDVYISHMF